MERTGVQGMIVEAVDLVLSLKRYPWYGDDTPADQVGSERHRDHIGALAEYGAMVRAIAYACGWTYTQDRSDTARDWRTACLSVREITHTVCKGYDTDNVDRFERERMYAEAFAMIRASLDKVPVTTPGTW